MRLFFFRNRAGEPYDGPVIRCNDPELVKFPTGSDYAYARKDDGSINKRVLLRWNRPESRWERVR